MSESLLEFTGACVSRNNVSRVTLIVLIDSEELVDQLRYTDGTVRLPSMRSICAFTPR